MIDTEREELVLLNDARKLFPQRPSKETLWRWALGRGLMGVRLESTLIGSNRYTSRQAAGRFNAAVNAASEARRGVAAVPKVAEQRASQTERDREIDMAQKRLAALGLL
jgi:hypothetical protein